MRRAWMFLGLLAASLVLLVGVTSVAQVDGSAPSGDAGSSSDAGVQVTSPEIEALRQKTARIVALVDGKLDVAIKPSSLFVVSLSNQRAIAVEVRRLRAVVQASRTSPADAGADATVDAAADGADAGADAGTDGAADRGLEDSEQRALWEAHLQFDEVRLQFLSLPSSERRATLALHAKRQKDATLAERLRREAQERKRKAATAEKRALEQAAKENDPRRKRLKMELARLRGLQGQLSELDYGQLGAKRGLTERPNIRLRWQAERDRVLQVGTTGAADDLHALVFVALRHAQQQLWEATDVLSADKSSLPKIGGDDLPELLSVLDTRGVEALRSKLTAERARLRLNEQTHRKRLAEQLALEVQSINEVRLSLLPHLSAKKRDKLLSLSTVGRAMARAELGQIVVLLRYHVVVAVRWVRDFSPRHYRPDSRVRFYWQLFQLFAILVVFAWWYRRSDGWLLAYKERLEELRRRQLGRERFVQLLRRIRAAGSWLLLIYLLRALLSADAQQLLEVQLIVVVLTWILGEIVLVETVDALFVRHQRHRVAEVAELRLQSLRLIGRIVVGFGLALSLSHRLAGAGTIYNWAWGLCWWAAIPVAFVLVYRWKKVIFERINLRGKHTAVTGWVVRHEESWLRFVAAAVGGVYLLVRGINRVVRGWLSGFVLSRRVQAYWFRRGAEQKERDGDVATDVAFTPLTDEEWAALDPIARATEMVPSVADPQVEQVVQRIDEAGGGVFAVVGEYGSGKSTLLRRIGERCDVKLIVCPAAGVDPFWSELREALELPADADQETVRERVHGLGDDTAILVDDAHHLVRPVIGGLDDFDELLELARESSMHACTWVFALDAVIWQFFQRARGSRPLFDDVIALEPWSEEGIVRLLHRRAKDADIVPSFDALMRQLPEDADDIDRADARGRAETNTYRLLWDYSGGNPAVALHFWRESLKRDGDAHVVRLFKAPDTSDIERLPDSAVFVLRAVVQLEIATVADVAAATMLSTAQVADSLRYALSRGYVALEDGHYSLDLNWFRAITNVLQRRHLLASGEEN